ncbi:hypothetical protein [Actinoplanes sp. N902-109]|uniref:hypothetical protein n=1 Tax=Actinoplanes sp. (strain N902-109) TaxID=649831 RepID=UPI0003295384|nr:hypothetical protein [Actinoplanes sp. N902-109]AGL14883.1 hypothetical protein L083_1373 [Actinoplanes sp. N902-109]
MNVRKQAGALLGLTVVALGGCGAADQLKDAAASPPPTPQEQLLNALPGPATGAFHFALKGGEQPMEGVLDATKKSYRIDISQKDPDLGFTMTMKFLVVDDKSWIKINFSGTEKVAGLPKFPKKWMLVDRSKLHDSDDAPLTYDNETDPAELSAVFGHAADVRRTGSTFSGTTDLTEQGKTEVVDQKTVDALGPAATTVPFEAVVDAQGRLTKAVIKVPAAGKIKAERYEAVYDQYGTAESPAEPAAGEQQKATAATYEILNS